MALRACGLIIFRRVPPASHVDPGEDDMTTALRETEEEAGLHANHFRVVDGFRKELNYKVNNKEKTVIYWLAELKDPAAQVKLSNEHQDFRWLPLKEACSYVGYQDMQDTLNDAYRFLQGNLKP
uniref:Bis(5'-nucleosyl)-tetraphosphatase [asymmetrical] n=1 Tax=Pyxicephalus adspersus TaxID=30357 RepID=A0AAV3A839_PYXAD|nr:TPA: hypothetical protein GDO54_014667 [Pyxicephalus adspersus]